MATKVKDQATATQAALGLNKGVDVPVKNGEPIAPKEKTTSETLFPEFTTDDGGIVNRPVKPYEDKSKPLPVTATPVPTGTPEPQDQKPPTTAPTSHVYLKPEELTGKMVRLKVDGIEQDVPAESLIKTNQLERHLNTQLQNLAEERRKLELERSALRTPLAVPEPPKPVKEPPKTQEVSALETRLAEMQQQMQGLQATLIPQIQEAGIKRVEQMARERLGTEDFRTYFDKIKESALEEAAKPEVAASPQARAYFDSDAFYFQKYQELKLKDLMSKAPAPAPNPNAPVLQTQQGAPVVMNSHGQPVSLPAFESSGGVPSKMDANGDWAAQAQKAFDAARQSGNTEAWMAYYKIKAQVPN